MKEREISLIDLLVEVLLSWRIIVVFMLIGGILLGAFSYVNSSKAEQAQLAQKAQLEQELAEKKAQLEATQQGNDKVVDTEISVTMEYLLERMTTAQLNNINLALNYEEYAAERQAYINDSLLMQIDPAKVPQSRLTFMVDAEEAQVEDIVRIYEDMISNDMLTWLENEDGNKYTALNYSEVISFERHSRSLDSGSNSFSINVIHLSESMSKKLADLIVRYMGEQQEGLQEQLGEHTIEVVNQSFAYIVNNSLMTTQRNYRNEVTTYITSAENLKANFGANERKYYDLLVSGGKGYTEVISQSMQTEESLALEAAQETAVQEATNLLAEVKVTPASVSLMQVILGMVLFAFIYVFYVFVKYILNTKIRANDDVKEIYGIAQLGAIPVADTKKKPFDFVDKWILKLRNYNKRVFTEEEAVGLAAVAVKMAAKKEEVNAVYCIGCDMQERAENIAEQIGGIVGEDNISLTLLNNVLYNQESMAQLADAKAVVLLEKAGETLYEEIANELELLQRQEIKVLGAIVVE